VVSRSHRGIARSSHAELVTGGRTALHHIWTRGRFARTVDRLIDFSDHRPEGSSIATTSTVNVDSCERWTISTTRPRILRARSSGVPVCLRVAGRVARRAQFYCAHASLHKVFCLVAAPNW
jgi:hypothetical protein